MNQGPRLSRGISPAELSRLTFRAYLQRYGLSLLDVALAGQVRLLSVWNVQQGIPVRNEHAMAIRAGLSRLIGEPYTAHIETLPEEIIHLGDSQAWRERKGNSQS